MQRNVTLEKVIGLTAKGNAALACDPNNDLVAYPAGCTVVLLNTRKGHQSHLLNTSRKTVVCLAYSPDGKYLVTGECGHQPALRVWDMSQTTYVPVAELMGHKYGVNCAAFSPNMRYIVSVGTQHDMIVNVWDWKVGVKVASNKVSAKVKAVAFSENGSYFVTVGNRNVKFWYLEHSRFTKYKEAVPLMGRSAILGEQRNNYFNDVACGKGAVGDYTFAITKSGLLCEFNNRRLLDKWVDLKTAGAHCLSVGQDIIVVGCNDGIVRCFHPQSLQFVSTLPRPHFIGVDVAQALNIMNVANQAKNVTYPDTISIALDEINNKVISIYSDHSIYVWDVKDIKRVGKSHSFLYHSACIWGVEMYPSNDHNSDMAVPPGCFITCSSDNSIRFWNVDSRNQPINPAFRNIYSDELIKTIYIDNTVSSKRKADPNNTKDYDGQNGVRSVRVSPDGQQLASGDREGNIRIYDMMTFEEVCRIEAHDAEVLCLEYSPITTKKRFLASASRDRLIHVFNADDNYSFLQTLDDHSSSITAVKFLCQGSRLWLASCGADKTIIFRHLQPGNPAIFVRDHIIVGKTTLYDMEVNLRDRQVVTACQDRNIRVFDVSTGKLSKSYKGSYAEEGSLIKVVVDHSGKYLASSCTDKTLCLIDYNSGDCISTMLGHSELVTGLKFTEDGKYLISASGDSCLFVWKLPQFMATQPEYHPPPKEEYNMGQLLGQLPPWAAKQSRIEFMSLTNSNSKQIEMPKGRWAQKLDTSSTGLRSVNSFNSVIPKVTVGSDDGNAVVLIAGNEDTQSMPAEYHSLGSDPPKHDIGTYEAGVDGDVEDCSDGEPQHSKGKGLVYYPNQEDSNSEYTIRSMDVNELIMERKLQTDYSATDSPSNSKFGSPDSDMDDGASTPSTNEPADKNFPSLLSGSTESLDKTDYEDRFVKSNFESLVGPDGQSVDKWGAGNSLSSQFLTKFNNARNSALISAARQTKEELNSARKREELQKRIEATRQKLQSVGFRAPLTNSQSSMDLRRIGDNTRFISSLSRAKPSKEENSGGGSGGLRRAISLSNLNAPIKPAEKNSPKGALAPDYGPLMDKLSHCTSYEVLYQVDDRPVPPARRNSVSSLNKSKSLSSSRRNFKKLSASTDNIAHIGDGGDYSSSEEAVKHARKLPSRELNSASPLSSRSEGLSDRRPNSPATSVTSDNITKELCLKTVDLLEQSAEALVQLHKRILAEVGPSNGKDLLQTLSAAAAQTQKKLQAVTSGAGGPPAEVAPAPMQGDMVLIMQQYSDMLVSMVQQQISSNPP
ncbi:mitogen-activated protein kinase-binding protein 1 [Neocloeon triangulifer]|uniref:mitogen-activated protein kinase-binding protein 1 n=1 Tax=Neocloeon triangulifer TaxID=2078957 RepID=UPI00286F481A|nr:mitogen-activated protein kinase-binding protein 1 [Neocloeon triangulifer]